MSTNKKLPNSRVRTVVIPSPNNFTISQIFCIPIVISISENNGVFIKMDLCALIWQQSDCGSSIAHCFARHLSKLVTKSTAHEKIGI
jgi:hypothetical protein